MEKPTTQSSAREKDAESAKADFDRTVMASLRVIGYFLGAGLFVVMVIAAQSARWDFTPLLAALAVAMVSAGFGFIFGIPRSLSTKPADTADPKATVANPAYEAQGSLEQIADWLTKILVGAGLTQLPILKVESLKIADLIGSRIQGADPQQLRLFGLAVLGYFGAVGFLGGYLATKLVLAAVLAAAEQSNRKFIQQTRDLGEAINKELLASAKASSGEAARSLPAGADKRASVADAEKWDTTVVATKEDDPQKGRFGGEAARNNRILSATVEELAGSRGELFTVRLKVETTDPNKPLTDPVKLFLHDTFKPNTITVLPTNGLVELKWVVWGAFTVGAITDGGNTHLELDLAEIKEAPMEFRRR